MAHSTTSGSYSRDASTSRANAKSAGADSSADSGLEKFPDHVDSPMFTSGNGAGSSSTSPVPGLNIYANGIGGSSSPAADRWAPRKGSRSIRWGQTEQPPGGFYAPGGTRPGRQKSISEAFRSIRGRNGSVSQNAHELAGALRAPVSYSLIVSLVSSPCIVGPPRGADFRP